MTVINDLSRAAIIAFAQSVFPVLVIAGIADFKDSEIAAIMLLISNGITLGALLFKVGQGTTPTP